MTKLKLKRSAVRSMMAGLRALDGRQEVAKDNDGRVLGILAVPYDLGLKARYAVARTIAKIGDEVDASEAARNAMIAAHRKAHGGDASHDADLEKAVLDFLAEEVEVEVFLCQVSELKLDTNRLAPSLIAALLPMLEGEV